MPADITSTFNGANSWLSFCSNILEYVLFSGTSKPNVVESPIAIILIVFGDFLTLKSVPRNPNELMW